jgi:hypothetical protein
VRDLAVFAALSFALAALVDVWFLYFKESCADPLALSLLVLAWGMLRMYTPAAGALLAARVILHPRLEEPLITDSTIGSVNFGLVTGRPTV